MVFKVTEKVGIDPTVNEFDVNYNYCQSNR